MRFPLMLSLLGIAGFCAADVAVTPESGGYRIKAAAYEAAVGDKGGLTSVKVGQTEFVDTKVSFAYGTYFYQDGAYPLNAPTSPDGSTVTAEGERGAVKCTFSDRTFTLEAKNRTEKPITFYLILSGKASVAQGPDGGLTIAPATQGWNQASWFQGKAKLSIDGFSRLWGPWENRTQVVELGLAVNQSATLTFAPGAASVDEQNAVAKMIEQSKAAETDLNVYSPRSLQVFQRTGLYTGQIAVAGRVRARADKVQVRLTGTSLKGALPGKWQTVALNPVDGSFQGRVDTVPGGWYKLEIRAVKGKAAVATATVDKVGLGEVFVGAGQSNSTNCGQERTKQTSGMVSSFDGTSWVIADDPQPGPHDKSQGGSFWPAFGDAMYARYKVPIGVAVTGHGGTSVNQWQPGAELLTWTGTRLQQLGIGGFRALLWHQGEGDVNMDPEEYAERLTNTIIGSKRLAGWDFPWFVAQVSYHNAQNPKFETVRSAQKMLWDRGIAFEGPDTDTLTGDNRDWNGNGIHFSPKGLKAHGQMWTEKVAVYLDKVLGIKR